MAAWVADGLTAFRLALAGYLAWLGFIHTESAETLTLFVYALLLGWTADILDGWFARKASMPTRLGQWDFPLDMAMVLGSLIGLTAAGFIPVKGTVLYLSVATLLVGWFPTKGMAMAVASPSVFAPFVLAMAYAPAAFWFSVLWAVLVLMLDWRRFEGVVLDFIDTFPGSKLKPLGTWWRQWRGLKKTRNAHQNPRE